MMFGSALRLKSTVQTDAGSNRITMIDEITNFGGGPARTGIALPHQHRAAVSGTRGKIRRADHRSGAAGSDRSRRESTRSTRTPHH